MQVANEESEAKNTFMVMGSEERKTENFHFLLPRSSSYDAIDSF